MPDYIIPQYPIKRLRYFNNQFLNENDFIDDQAGHLARDRAQLRALCAPGVCEGLVLTYPGAATAPPSISPGVAVDNAGRMIVLKDAINGPSPTGLAAGEYLVHVRFNEVSSDPSANQGGPGDTRFLSQPLFGATLKTVALPAGAVVLGNFTVTTVGQISGHTDAARQFSGLRLPGPSATVPVLRNDGTIRGDSSTDSALLSGTLTVRRDVTAALGATLTLTNGRPAPGATTAGTAIDLNTYDPGANAPAVRIQALGDGNNSGHLVISTKAPNAQTNALVERLRITSAGVLQVSNTSSLSAPVITVGTSMACPSITGAVNFAGATSMASTLAVTGAATLSSTLDVIGATTLSSTLTATGGATLSSTLAVSGATTMASTLAVTGAATMASTLSVTGAATMVSTLSVTGAATMASTLSVTGAATMASTLSITGATTAGSTLAVTGVITASAGLTAAVNQHIILSGTGRFKHGTRTLTVPAVGPQSGNGPFNMLPFARINGIGSGANHVVVPFTLPVGVRILAVRGRLRDNTATIIQMELRNQIGDAIVSFGSTGSAGTGAVQTLTLSSLTQVIAAGEQYFVLFVPMSGGSDCFVHRVEVDYDQP